MADAVSRVCSGQRIGVFAMQHGPGTENAFGGVAQAYGESSPIVVLPGGYPRRLINVPPNFNAYLNFQHVTKWCEQVMVADAVPDAMRRAFTQVRNGRPRPVLVEIPSDVMTEDVPEPLSYKPAPRAKSAPDSQAVSEAADMLLKAERPVLYAGQGVHYARAWQSLRELAELLEAPVTGSLEGKSAFPENHPLSLGVGQPLDPEGGPPLPQQGRRHFRHRLQLRHDELRGASAAQRAEVHPGDTRRGRPEQGDADRARAARRRGADAEGVDCRNQRSPRRQAPRPCGGRRQEIAQVRDEWLAEWKPKLTCNEAPLSPYRVIWDLLHTVDVDNTIITHDAGSPRDQMAPFWRPTEPLGYIGWGKTTQLGYGLGLAMGAKLARPDKLCINVWGDAAIGFTGMDFETAVRERIPILSILLNNFSMAIELKVMAVATEKFRSTDISGNYADMAKAFGGYGERVTEPSEIIPAIKRGIQQTQEGRPALLEFITQKETQTSDY